MTLLSLCAGEEIYLCSSWIFGKILKISSILTLLFLCAGEGNLPVLYLYFWKIAKKILHTDVPFSVCRRKIYLDFWKNAKNIPKTDPSFCLCKRRDLSVLNVDFWKNAKIILHTDPSFSVCRRRKSTFALP
jgi:hypothetical protein